MARTLAGALLNAINIFTKTQAGTPQVLTSSGGFVAFDASNGNNARLTLTENTTLQNPTNLIDGSGGNIQITQGAGPYTLAFGGAWTTIDGSATTVSTTNGAVNLLTWYYDNGVLTYSFGNRGIA